MSAEIFSGKSERTLASRGMRAHTWYTCGPRGAVSLIAHEITDPATIAIYSRESRLMGDLSIVSWLNGVPYLAIDLGTHRTLEGHREYTTYMPECEFLCGPCWYDGTSLGAVELLRVWTETDGTDAVVLHLLEKHYRAQLDEGDPSAALGREVVAEAEQILRSGT